MSNYSATMHMNTTGSLENPKVPKRTPMACQFCRGRKLKCDGLRPSCSNCNKRANACIYTPVTPPKK